MGRKPSQPGVPTIDERTLGPRTWFAQHYNELRRAAGRFAGHLNGHTLQATAILSEAFIRIVNAGRARWEAVKSPELYAAATLRSVVTDYARWKLASKRGGDSRHVVMPQAIPGNARKALEEVERMERLIALNGAIEDLHKCDPVAMNIFLLRGSRGMPYDEIAHILTVPKTTVQRKWEFARLFLSEWLADHESN